MYIAHTLASRVYVFIHARIHTRARTDKGRFISESLFPWQSLSALGSLSLLQPSLHLTLIPWVRQSLVWTEIRIQ